MKAGASPATSIARTDTGSISWRRIASASASKLGGGAIHWTHRLTRWRPLAFNEFPTIPDLLRAPEGACGHVYFHDAPDWSKVLIFFNGALTADKMRAERAVFQRWSWAKRFRHPVFCIADPVTLGKNPIVLGWYLGKDGPNALPSILRPVLHAIRTRNPDARIVGFGSSGGGFAAIGAALTGHLDHAIAVNPQTDALEFEHRGAVDSFLAMRKGVPCASDLKRYDLAAMKPEARVTYVQNLGDTHHRDVHYRPFRAHCEGSAQAGRFRFVEFSDHRAGHAPPGLDGLTRLIGDEWACLLTP